MKKPLLPILLLLTLNLFGQDASFISFGAELNPKIVTNVFKKSTDFDTYYPLSGSLAGNVYLHLNPSVSLQSGMSFSILRTGQKDYSILLGCDQDGNGNALPRNSWVNSEYTHYYAGIPVAIFWKVFNKTNSPYLKLGQETLFEVGKKRTHEIVACGDAAMPITSPQAKEFSDVIVMIDFGIGYEFSLNEKINFYLEPNIEYAINPFLQNNQIPSFGFNEFNKHFLNIGINSGLRF